MKTNLDAIRTMDKSLVAIILKAIYDAKEDNDEVLINAFKSLESIEDWLDYQID